MKKIQFLFFSLVLSAFFLNTLVFAREISAQTKNELVFFYSETCPHCKAEEQFLDKMMEKYPALAVKRYSISDENSVTLMKQMTEEFGVGRYFGQVPLTFIGDKFILGFNNETGKGAEIEKAITEILGQNGQNNSNTGRQTIQLPVIGEINAEKYSLPSLAITLGFFDGFNVCSLGALILIIGLTMVFRSRKKIIAYGGIFIITTSVVYGVLITLWYHLFETIAPYIKYMELAIGLLGLWGAYYFTKEYIRFKKYGAVCALDDGKSMVSKAYVKIRGIFEKEIGFLALMGAIASFAAVITIVEFPCSAVVPVIFAGILSKAGTATGAYIGYIALYIAFYMLDELIVFGIAAAKMEMWLASPKYTTIITLLEAILLGLLGIYYLYPFVAGIIS
jgi:thiol-disulfide isomerase/thioredoxin